MLHVHRAAHAGDLVDALSTVLAVPAGDDPFTPEVVAVPSRGIERWLSQELSLRLGTSPDASDGVCANVVFPFPATLVGWAVQDPAQGPVDVRDRRVQPTAWAPSRLVWQLLDVVDAGGVDDLGPLGAHLAGPHGRDRRLPALRHVADLFDRYGVHRPEMVRAWHGGQDVDGLGRPLDDVAGRAAWQPRLWRAVRPQAGPSFPERIDLALPALLRGDAVAGLPRRLCVYGLTALPASYAEVLDALATAHDVHLFLLHPSPDQWSDLEPSLPLDPPRPLRTVDPTASTPDHPLVHSWGRDARELQVVLGGRGHHRTHGAPHDDDPGVSLLRRLQDDVRRDRRPPGRPLAGGPDDRHVLGAPDTTTAPSVAVHACHGQVRQVEVLRDAILHLLQADPTLEPRDVVVMCPDVETFAPLVAAVFGADAGVAGADGGHGLPDVRVRVADRALRSVNPLLRTVDDLLRLPDSRLEASTLVDLLHREPVCRRFRLDHDDLGTVERWIDELRVRWGLDADHRREHGVHAAVHTWREALDRLLVGVAVGAGGPDLVGDVLPYVDVEGSDVAVLGRFAELLDRLAHVADELRAPRDVDAWCRSLADAVDLVASADGDDAWQRGQLDDLLDELHDDAGDVAVPVTLAEVRALLQDRLRGRPSRANHRSGDLTVCTLVPMRSVPYRVVCLLGLDDGVFPRHPHPSGDDLIARDPRVGDRDPRSEDRQLLLDALMAAGQHLVVTYRGMHERTNTEVPPCVPLAELLDTIDATARTADGRDATTEVLVRHPLRAADPMNFRPDPVPGGAGPDRRGPFSFDPVARAGADAAQRPPVAPVPFVDRLPGPAEVEDVVDLSALVRFLEHVPRGYVRDRLGLGFPDADEPIDDHLPVELAAGLAEWQVGDPLLRAAVEGRLDEALDLERRRGTLPVGALAATAVEKLRANIAAIQDLASTELGPPRRGDVVDVDVDVHGTRVVGRVGDVVDGVIARRQYSRVQGKYLLRLWVPWLVLTASGHDARAVLVGRGPRPETAAVARFVDGRPDQALEALRVLLDLYRAGRDAPLPLLPDGSAVFVQTLLDGGDRDRALSTASREWVKGAYGGSSGTYGDGVDPYVRTAFDTWSRFEDCLEEVPYFTESGDGWDVDEPTRFGRLALRLWRPLFETLERGE